MLSFLNNIFDIGRDLSFNKFSGTLLEFAYWPYLQILLVLFEKIVDVIIIGNYQIIS